MASRQSRKQLINIQCAANLKLVVGEIAKLSRDVLIQMHRSGLNFTEEAMRLEKSLKAFYTKAKSRQAGEYMIGQSGVIV